MYSEMGSLFASHVPGFRLYFRTQERGQIFKSKCCSVNRVVIFIHLGPDVQSIVSLTISLVKDSLSLLVYIKSNMLVFYFIFFLF